MIVLKSSLIAKNVMLYLGKDVNEFSKEDLGKIKEISVDGADGELNFLDISNFNNLEDLIVSNTFLSSDDILIIRNLSLLKSIRFNKCFFENANDVGLINVEEIHFFDCDIIDYSFIKNMTNLKSLSIVNGDVSLNDLMFLKDLNFLRLTHSEISDLNKFNFPNLKELYINDTNINNYDILTDLDNLSVLDLSSEQCNDWNEYVNILSKKKVLVLEEGFPYNNGGRGE